MDKTTKRYRISFLAKSVDTLHPSSAAVASAVENALRSIGLIPDGSQVESSKEVGSNEAKEEAPRHQRESETAARNIRALQEAALRDNAKGTGDGSFAQGSRTDSGS
jgi:hypothetical protein